MPIRLPAPQRPRRLPPIAARAILVLLAAAALGGGSSPSVADDGACKGDQGSYRLYVTVDRVKSVKGRMEVTVYGAEPSRFLKSEGSLYVARFDVEAPTVRTCLRLPGPGRYAVAVYQDDNGNGKFDRNFMGIPTEPFGFSRNPTIMFGPPRYKEVDFTVARDGEAVKISLMRM